MNSIAPTKPRLLVIDDEPDLLELLSEWFQYFDYELATAPDGYVALALQREHPFDVVVTDLKLPGPSGLHLLAMFKQLDPRIEVIVLSGQGTMEDAIEALREGRAFDFIQKPIKNLRQLNDVIERALARRAATREAGVEASAPRPVPKPPSYVEPLSPRERQILDALSAGFENREIADRLGVSEKTVKNGLTRIYEKLKVKNRTQALLLAQQYALIQGHEGARDEGPAR